MSAKRRIKVQEPDADAASAGDIASSAAEVPAASDELETLQRERDELFEKYQRALADFRNYQQRSVVNEREARRQGAADVLQSVLGVLDHFDIALAQDPSQLTAEQIIQGVTIIRNELVQAISQHGASPFEPAPNDEFDPIRHHAVQQMDAPDVEPGRIAQTLQIGYAMGERVLRAASVIVAPHASTQSQQPAEEHESDASDEPGAAHSPQGE